MAEKCKNCNHTIEYVNKKLLKAWQHNPSMWGNEPGLFCKDDCHCKNPQPKEED